MTNGFHFPILNRLCLHDETLPFPVLQHLVYCIPSHTRSFDGNAVLHSLINVEFDIQSFKDGIVLTNTLTLIASCIVTAVESVLDAVAEEEESVLEERVCDDTIDIHHLRSLSF